MSAATMSVGAQPRALPRSILVVGDGQVGVITAIALRMALPTTQVTVIPCPPDRAAFADRIGTAMPFTNRLHDRLGISEMDLVQKAGASHRLVTRYRNWAGAGHDEVSAYGSGNPALGNAFTGHFEGVRRPGHDPDQLILSPAAALAMTGRFCPPDGDPNSPLATIDYALRWNVAAYRELLISRAMQIGVQYAPHLPVDVQYGAQGNIASVTLNDNAGMIAADLYIDCSGPMRWLISKMPGVALDSWADDLPCDRVLIAAPGEAVLALEDRMSLTPDGWLCEIGGRDGVHRIFAFPDALGTDAAEGHLMAAGATDAFAATIHPGALASPFIGNVIALGDAAASFEPVGGSNLDLAHRQLGLLIELLPGRDVEPRERDEYNRRATLMAHTLRDWIASHYAAPGVSGTPFSNRVAQLRKSASLARLLDQHGRHGRMPFFEETPMLPAEWSAMLRALGVQSMASAHALAQPPERTNALMKQAENAARAAVDAAPPYLDWLNSVLPQSV
jgi:tryptophan 7-halogenase